jgi:uncharacterized delta-60 repeat protein
MKHNLLFTVFFILLMQNCFSQTVALDSTFGTGGKVVNSSITSGQVIQLQSNGKIVSCFLSSFSISGNIKLARFNADGSIDSTFGTNGFVDTILVNETGGVNMMKIQSDDKILVTGFLSSNGSLNSSFFNFCTARYFSNGTLDTTFGINGYAITNFGIGTGSSSSAIEIQNDGAILIGGFIYQSNNLDVAIVKYLTNGTIDTSFGTNGKFIYNFGTNTIPFSGGISDDVIVAIILIRRNCLDHVIKCVAGSIYFLRVMHQLDA